MAPVFAFLSALSALLSTASALPRPSNEESLVDDCAVSASDLSQLQSEMPTMAGLPSNQGSTLVFAAVGVGHQNYTCNGTNYLQTEGGDGAKARLYDATTYFNGNSSVIPSTPSQRLSQYLSAHQKQRQANAEPQLKVLGEHFFDAEVRPNFDLFNARPKRYLLAAKVDAVTSPDAGSVAWLYLDNLDAGLTKGLTSVYRVQTSGGGAPSSCSTSGEPLSVPYSAEYWFFN